MFPPTFTPHSPQPQAQISPYSPQNQPWYTQNSTAVMAPLSSPIPSSQQQCQPHYHHNQPTHPQSEVYLQQGLNSHQQDYPQEQQHHHHHQSHPPYLQQQQNILSPQHYQHNGPLHCVSHPYVQPLLITPEPREGSYPTSEFLSPQQGMNAPSPSLQDTPSSDHAHFISQLSTPSMAHGPTGTMPWGTIVDFDTKDLFDPSEEALRLNPVVINPAQLYTPPRVHVLDGGDIDGRDNNGMYMYSHGRSYDDNDSVDGIDDDADARRHLSDSSYLSSTPPLSPNILDHHQHSHLMQILTGLNTSSTAGGSVSSSPYASELFSNGSSTDHPHSGSRDRCLGDEDEDHDEIYGNGEEEEEEEEYHQQQQDQRGDQKEAEERQFQCQQCHKRFLRQYNLNAHLKTHSLERLHKCDQCDKSFLRPYDLSRHQRIHSKTKPYSCVICGLIFIRNDAIWRHYRKLHHGHPDVPTSRRDKSKQKSASAIVASKPRASTDSFA